ncbi:hypothetical protein ABZV60_28170 [Streptomyces sp. NPDC004787]|uniref:hypothetical protein n=1 Tax=Streptomyces sp. NPDC004787 TaxID=3154291 RepID=UPI0033BD6310
MRGTFDDAPLNRLFPHLSPADVASLEETARAVDATRADGDRAGWDWTPDHAIFPGPQPWTSVVLGLDVVQRRGRGDDVEFQLHVVWTDFGQLAVDTAVNVACWCDTDHAGHGVDALRLAVDEETPLPHAFRTGAERLVGWLDDPRDADFWRDRAGLPPRWSV